MTTKKLSDLPAAAPILGTETVFGLQSGFSVQIPYGSFNGITANSVSGGAVSGTSGVFSGAVSGTSGDFSGAVSGTTGAFSGAVSVAGNISLTNTTGLSSPTSRFALTKTSQADYHITSTTNGASPTNTLEYGLTFAVASGTQAGIIISENGSDGTAFGFYNTSNYATGPQLRMSIEPTGVVSIPAGKLYCPGQVVQTIYDRNDARTTYAWAASGVVTYLTDNFATITPKFSNSGIYIQWNPSFECQHNATFRLFRSIGGVDTEIGRNTLDAGAWSGWANPGYDADTNSTARTNHHIFMDYPATTAAVTYKFGIAASDGVAGIYNQNRTYSAVGQSVYEVAISQTILQEITV